MISPSEYSTDEQELVEFSPLAIQVVSALATKHGVALRKFAESIYSSANTRFGVDDILQLSWMEVMRRLDIGNLTFNEGDPLPALCTIVRQTRASLVKSNTQKLRDFSMETTVDDDSVDVTVPPTVDTILTTEVKEVVRDGITLLEDERAQFKSLCKEEKTIRLEKKILKKLRVKSSDQFNMAFNYISWIVLRPVIY